MEDNKTVRFNSEAVGFYIKIGVGIIHGIIALIITYYGYKWFTRAYNDAHSVYNVAVFYSNHFNALFDTRNIDNIKDTAKAIGMIVLYGVPGIVLLLSGLRGIRDLIISCNSAAE